MSIIKNVFTRNVIAHLSESSVEAGQLATAINAGIKSKREALAAKKSLKLAIENSGIQSKAATAVVELMNQFTPAVKAVRAHLASLKKSNELDTPEFNDWLAHGDELKATIDGLRKYFGGLKHGDSIYSLQTVKKADATESIPAGSYLWAVETDQNKQPVSTPADPAAPVSSADPVPESGKGNNNNRPQHEVEAGEIAGDIVEFENSAEVIMAALDMMDKRGRIDTMISLFLHLSDAERVEVTDQVAKRLIGASKGKKAA